MNTEKIISEVIDELVKSGAVIDLSDYSFAPYPFRRHTFDTPTLKEFIEELRFKGRAWVCQPKGNKALLDKADELERIYNVS